MKLEQYTHTYVHVLLNCYLAAFNYLTAKRRRDLKNKHIGQSDYQYTSTVHSNHSYVQLTT